MTTVERIRVGDVLRLERREVVIDPNAEHRLIGVYSFGKGIFHRDPKPGAELGDYRFFRIEPGDLVLSNIQAWEGAIALATNHDAGTIGTHRFLSYVPIADQIDTNWARWFFLSEPGMQLIRRAAPGTAVRNRTPAVKRFEDLVIPLPTIEEQKRVAALLELATQASDDLDTLIRRSTDLAVAAQVSLVSHPGAEPSANGWARVSIGDLVVASDNQVTVEPSVEYRIAGTYSFGKGLIDRGCISGGETSYKVLTRLDEGNIVMSKLNGWEGAVAVVGSAFHHTHVSSEFPTFMVDESRLLPGFFRGIARSRALWDQLDQTVRGSMVRRRRLSGSDFMRAQIWLPSVEHQARVSREIDALDRLIECSGQSAVRAAAIVPAILNREFAAVT
jgi:type I restriction enzyme S subunit